MKPCTRLPFASLFLLTLSLVPAHAADVSDLSIQGSVSTSESESDKYNFYGETADKFDNNIRELTVNSGYRFADGLRLSAQLYASDVDGLSRLDLDFASLDYSPQPWFGVRVGRNKSGLGLYGDSQDLDQVRTFANLPLGFYPRNTRSLNYTDGVTFYGNVPAGRAGSLDYTLLAGRIENIPGTALIARSAGGLTVLNQFTLPLAYGGTVFWNTPLDGLRVGVSELNIPHIGLDETLATEAFATEPGLTYSSTPLLIDSAYGPGTWNAEFAGTPGSGDLGLSEQMLSAEYTTGKWVFAAEWKQEPEHLASTIAALGVHNSYSRTREIDTYGMVTYQATKQIGLGIYYGFTDTNTINTAGTPSDLRDQGDAAAVIAYAPLSWWRFKVEFHQLNGLGLVNNAGDFNPNAPTAGTTWNYLVFKTTLSF